MASHHLHDLPSSALQRLEAAVERFEQAWRQERRRDLVSFLPDEPQERRATLLELIHVELELRLRDGDTVRVEYYLKRFPELKADRRAVLDLLVKEFRFRRPREPGLTAAEFERRFPSLKQELADRLETETATMVGRTMAAAMPVPPTTTKPPATPARPHKDVVRELAEGPLLDAEQRSELTKRLHTQFPNSQALLDELTRRGWLTAHQAGMVLQGRGGELVLGPYLVLDRLGEGGMGQVFKARHRMMKRVVALKVIGKGVLSMAEHVQRFHREIEAAAQLSHPNIVIAFDAGQAGSVHYFAMELVEGKDLARVLAEKGPLAVQEACTYVRQAALGLQHAHERGLVHRDIKPGNLILCAGDAGPTIKILDMGLARIRYDAVQRTRLTQIGEVMGTADYISPEQSLDSTRVDIRTDIYSLGCTLYHLLAGRPPFAGGSLVDKLVKHRSEDRPSLPGGIPSELQAIVARMMARNPDDRYATPRDVAVALAPFAARPAHPTPIPDASLCS